MQITGEMNNGDYAKISVIYRRIIAADITNMIPFVAVLVLLHAVIKIEYFITR